MWHWVWVAWHWESRAPVRGTRGCSRWRGVTTSSTASSACCFLPGDSSLIAGSHCGDTGRDYAQLPERRLFGMREVVKRRGGRKDGPSVAVGGERVGLLLD